MPQAGVSSAFGAKQTRRGPNPPSSVKIRVENHQQEEEQREQRSRDREQQNKNDGNGVLPSRAQPNAASYHSCQSGEDRQPRQNVECRYPAAGRQLKKEIKRYRCNSSVDRPEEPKPKLHDADPGLAPASHLRLTRHIAFSPARKENFT